MKISESKKHFKHFIIDLYVSLEFYVLFKKRSKHLPKD